MCAGDQLRRLASQGDEGSELSSHSVDFPAVCAAVNAVKSSPCPWHNATGEGGRKQSGAA